jgi:hypothetical protein
VHIEEAMMSEQRTSVKNATGGDLVSPDGRKVPSEIKTLASAKPEQPVDRKVPSKIETKTPAASH